MNPVCPIFTIKIPLISFFDCQNKLPCDFGQWKILALLVLLMDFESMSTREDCQEKVMILFQVTADWPSHPCQGLSVLSLHHVRIMVNPLFPFAWVGNFLDPIGPEASHRPLLHVQQKTSLFWKVELPFSLGAWFYSWQALEHFSTWTLQLALWNWAEGCSAFAKETQKPALQGWHVG